MDSRHERQAANNDCPGLRAHKFHIAPESWGRLHHRRHRRRGRGRRRDLIVDIIAGVGVVPIVVI